MAALRKGVFIVAAKRTPFGAYGGKLKDKSVTDLAEIAGKAVLASGNIDPKLINTVVFGNVVQSSRDAGYLSRHVGLRCGVPEGVPAFTVNRLCGSGFQAIVNGAQEIILGDAEMALVGGAENMSEAPFAVWDIRHGTKFTTQYKFEDVLWSALNDSHVKMPMAITAENLAEKYNITRAECDEFSLTSQKRWKQANEAGVFKNEMAPVKIKVKGVEVDMIQDEHPRDATIEGLAKLPSLFKKNGTVTAGSASGVCDGAGALVLASEEAVSRQKLKPLARLVAYAACGCDPKIMGIGPVAAINMALNRAKMTPKDIDLFEVNEAFAAQYLAVEKELKLDRSKTNVNGGAIALGHPVGASGARITAHLVHELNRKNLRYAVGSACIGGGQGIALILEKA